MKLVTCFFAVFVAAAVGRESAKVIKTNGVQQRPQRFPEPYILDDGEDPLQSFGTDVPSGTQVIPSSGQVMPPSGQVIPPSGQVIPSSGMGSADQPGTLQPLTSLTTTTALVTGDPYLSIVTTSYVWTTEVSSVSSSASATFSMPPTNTLVLSTVTDTLTTTQEETTSIFAGTTTETVTRVQDFFIPTTTTAVSTSFIEADPSTTTVTAVTTETANLVPEPTQAQSAPLDDDSFNVNLSGNSEKRLKISLEFDPSNDDTGDNTPLGPESPPESYSPMITLAASQPDQPLVAEDNAGSYFLPSLPLLAPQGGRTVAHNDPRKAPAPSRTTSLESAVHVSVVVPEPPLGIVTTSITISGASSTPDAAAYDRDVGPIRSIPESGPYKAANAPSEASRARYIGKRSLRERIGQFIPGRVGELVRGDGDNSTGLCGCVKGCICGKGSSPRPLTIETVEYTVTTAEPTTPTGGSSPSLSVIYETETETEFFTETLPTPTPVPNVLTSTSVPQNSPVVTSPDTPVIPPIVTNPPAVKSVAPLPVSPVLSQPQGDNAFSAPPVPEPTNAPTPLPSSPVVQPQSDNVFPPPPPVPEPTNAPTSLPPRPPNPSFAPTNIFPLPPVSDQGPTNELVADSDSPPVMPQPNLPAELPATPQPNQPAQAPVEPAGVPQPPMEPAPAVLQPPIEPAPAPAQPALTPPKEGSDNVFPLPYKVQPPSHASEMPPKPPNPTFGPENIFPKGQGPPDNTPPPTSPEPPQGPQISPQVPQVPQPVPPTIPQGASPATVGPEHPVPLAPQPEPVNPGSPIPEPPTPEPPIPEPPTPEPPIPEPAGPIGPAPVPETPCVCVPEGMSSDFVEGFRAGYRVGLEKGYKNGYADALNGLNN